MQTILLRRGGVCFSMMLFSLFLICICKADEVLALYRIDPGSRKVTVSGANLPLRSVFKAIKSQTGFTMMYNSDASGINGSERINIDFHEEKLDNVLAYIFRGKNLEWMYNDVAIVVRRRENVAAKKNDSSGTKIPLLEGKVVAADGSPVIGATVKVKGTGNGATTDEEGQFKILAVPENAWLIVSFIGYKTNETAVKHKKMIVVLTQDVSTLDEAIVVGYGLTTQRFNTGSVSRITSKDIQDQPVGNPLQALQGRMTGVMVTNSSGLPGSDVSIQIRGINSIAAGQDPLYIVDGVPFGSTPLNQWNGSLQTASGSLSPFNSINPADIESIEVLKDADATAIYGSRAANGVILITTKKGKAGRTKLDMNVYSGQSKATHLVPTLDTRQYLELRKEAFTSDGVNPTAGNAPDLKIFSPDAYTDFQKMLIGNTAKVTDAQVSISGGNQHTRFWMGGNYRNESTIFAGDARYIRGGGKLALDHNSINNRFAANVSVSYTADNNRGLPSGFNFALYPNYPLYDSTGRLNWIGGSNPLANTMNTAVSKTNLITGNAQFKYKVIPSLSLQLNLGYNSQHLNSLLMFPKSAKDPTAWDNYNEAKFGDNTTTTYIIEPQANYIRDIGRGQLHVLAGGTWQYSNTNSLFIAAENFSSDALLQNLSSAGNISQLYPPASLFTEYKYLSFFGRATYNFNEKYIVNASFRRDGSSRFGPGKQFGNFGAVGAAWIFSKERFIEDNFPIISFGKLRASYGLVGNDQIPDYQYLSTYRSGSTYQGNSGLSPARVTNPDYSWERNRKLEVGLELGALKDRILLTASWFSNRSDNQLVGYMLPSQTGFLSYQANFPALVQNKGWEFTLNTINHKSGAWIWKSSFNISFTDNKLISFPGLAGSSYADTYVEGRSLSIVRGYHYLRIDPGTGVPVFASASGKDTSLPAYGTDRDIMGKTMPDFFGGLSNSVSYKGFQLDFLFQFVKQEGYSPFYWPGVTKVLPDEAMNRWRKPGDNTDVPVATTLRANNAAGNAYLPYILSDRFWGDASYIRLKNVSLSYSLPVAWLRHARMSQGRIYLQGQNLLTFTGYKGSDPESPRQQYSTPMIKTITIGTQIVF
ncbi:SusC/RagA family TonB-linked outer membrane protein [Chitinophaga solisilvae]|uniref:SusC/RagA family TonB-linked outer membrane protein n=1 Tax=Chitinophaga solisilvae TaxID=1233460 RepID=UPI00136C1B58|nr:TonB-dependent receptor [Chitinophaga solisilvae]